MRVPELMVWLGLASSASTSGKLGLDKVRPRLIVPCEVAFVLMAG